MKVIPMPVETTTQTDVLALAVTVQHVAESIPLSQLVPEHGQRPTHECACWHLRTGRQH